MSIGAFYQMHNYITMMYRDGTAGKQVGFTVLRKDFTQTRNVLGEEVNAWTVVSVGLRGFIEPHEGPLRAMAEGTHLVQDWILYTDPVYDSSNNPIIQPADLIAQGTVTIASDGSYSSTGPVYRVQYIKNYYDKEWQVRLKVGQDERS